MSLGKYWEKNLKTKDLLVCDEKHGTRYFVCQSIDDFCKAAMHILRERLEGGWYYDDELDKSELAIKAATEYAGGIYKQRELEKTKTIAQDIADRNDIHAAFNFLFNRSKHEYEGFETIESERYK